MRFGPVLMHMSKEEAVFQRFALEMVTANPEMLELKSLGNDLEKAIFKGFKSVIKNVNNRLCVKHMADWDKMN